MNDKTIREIAIELNVSKTTVNNYLKKYDITKAKNENNTYMVAAADVEKLYKILNFNAEPQEEQKEPTQNRTAAEEENKRLLQLLEQKEKQIEELLHTNSKLAETNDILTKTMAVMQTQQIEQKNAKKGLFKRLFSKDI